MLQTVTMTPVKFLSSSTPAVKLFRLQIVTAGNVEPVVLLVIEMVVDVGLLIRNWIRSLMAYRQPPAAASKIMSQNRRLIIEFPLQILATPWAVVDSMYSLNVDVSLLNNLSFQTAILDVVVRVSNRKYEGKQNHSAAAFSSRTHLGKLQSTL